MDYLYTITHIEIPAPDFNKAVEFYSAVFNWGIEVVTIDRYAFFTIGNTGSGGGLDASLVAAPAKMGPQLVISVEDIENMVKKITENGGTIISEKQEIPGGHGYYCEFKDPNQNYMQLHTR